MDDRERRVRLVKIELGSMEIELAVVHDDEACGVQARNLTAELTPNRTARPPVTRIAREVNSFGESCGPVRLNRFAVEQILDGDRPQIAGRERGRIRDPAMLRPWFAPA